MGLVMARTVLYVSDTKKGKKKVYNIAVVTNTGNYQERITVRKSMCTFALRLKMCQLFHANLDFT